MAGGCEDHRCTTSNPPLHLRAWASMGGSLQSIITRGFPLYCSGRQKVLSQSRKRLPGPGHSWIQVGTGQSSLLALNGFLGQDFKYFDLPVLSSSTCKERERERRGGRRGGYWVHIYIMLFTLDLADLDQIICTSGSE